MHVLKIVLLGAAGVGKTSLIRQFVFGEFSEDYAPTATRAVYTPSVVLGERAYAVRLVDVPVIPYFPADSAAEWADFRGLGLRSAQAYVLVFDLHDLETFHYVKSVRDQICDARDEALARVPLFVAGNKQDLLRGGGRECREVAGLVKKHWKCGFVECSARHNWRVGALFREVVRALDGAEGGQKLAAPRFDSLHAHHHHHQRWSGDRRRGDSVVKCHVM